MPLLVTYHDDMRDGLQLILRNEAGTQAVDLFIPDNWLEELPSEQFRKYKERCMYILANMWWAKYRETLTPIMKEGQQTIFEHVIDGEVVEDAERTSIGDRRGTEATERILDRSNRERLAIQAPRDRRDDHPEAKAGTERDGEVPGR